MTTLADIKDQLLANKQASEDTTAAVMQLGNVIIANLSLQRADEARNRLRQKEQEIESKRSRSGGAPFSALTDSFKAGADTLNVASAAAFGATAQLAGRAVGMLISPFKFLASMIPSFTTLARLVKVGGPVSAAITLLYNSLKDIGERPEFTAAIQGITDLWSNNIIPTWNNILLSFEKFKESFNKWKGTETGQAAVQMFIQTWENIDKAIENFVINSLQSVSKSIEGIFDGINLMLDGEWIQGISKIINSALIFIQNIADTMITSIANLFGVDFGEDGTFLNFVNRKWSELQDSITQIWNNVSTFISEKWIGLTDTIKTLISFVGDNFGLMKDIIAASFDYEITRIINGFKKTFEGISTFIANIPDELYLMISKNLRFGMPTIEFPLPEWMQKWPINAPPSFTLLQGFEAGIGDATTQAAAQSRIAQRSAARDTTIQTLDRATASKLEELTAAQTELARNFQQVIINQSASAQGGSGGGAYILPAAPTVDILDSVNF